MIWFKKNSSDSGVGPFVEANAVNYNQKLWYLWLYDTNTKLLIDICDFNLFFGYSKPAIDYWTHVAFTISGTTATGYVNGTQVIQQTSNIPFIFGNSLTIGIRFWPGNSLHLATFDGCLAHLAIFDRAFSSQEINDFRSTFDDDQF